MSDLVGRFVLGQALCGLSVINQSRIYVKRRKLPTSGTLGLLV